MNELTSFMILWCHYPVLGGKSEDYLLTETEDIPKGEEKLQINADPRTETGVLCLLP